MELYGRPLADDCADPPALRAVALVCDEATLLPAAWTAGAGSPV
jgi:hypothetical protein